MYWIVYTQSMGFPAAIVTKFSQIIHKMLIPIHVHCVHVGIYNSHVHQHVHDFRIPNKVLLYTYMYVKVQRSMLLVRLEEQTKGGAC